MWLNYEFTVHSLILTINTYSTNLYIKPDIHNIDIQSVSCVESFNLLLKIVLHEDHFCNLKFTI